MGAEIKNPITRRLAPHQRFFPTIPATAVEIPGPQGRWGLYPGEPEACRRQVLPFLRTMVQLGLLVVLFKRFQIEGRAFLAIATLALFALPVHYLAPYRWKKPLFVAVSMVGLFWVFGTEVGSVVLGLAALLLGICFLPVSWTCRAGCLAVVAAVLCLRAARQLLAVVPSTVWPVLGSVVHVPHYHLHV